MTLTPKGQIDREGRVSFGDASLSVWEEGIREARDAGGFAGARAWELAFKRQVFARIVQTLNRLGWQCVVPQDYVKQYSLSFARNHRACSKGDLKGWLSVSGRQIEFETWQGVNTPTRPDHGGRYESNKEACMPYLLRIEMERTRRRIRDYLCAVFAGYEFDSKSRSIYRKPLQLTAMERIQLHQAERSGSKDFNATHNLNPRDRKTADGHQLTPGQKVFLTDRHGRWLEGTAYYNCGNMWWVVLGRYDYKNEACFELRATPPENLRAKSNERERRKRLEGLLADAVKAMDFDRAKTLKGILWPKAEPLFYIMKGDDYFAPNYCGYRREAVDAGKYTEAELQPYAGDIKRGDLRAVPVAA